MVRIRKCRRSYHGRQKQQMQMWRHKRLLSLLALLAHAKEFHNLAVTKDEEICDDTKRPSCYRVDPQSWGLAIREAAAPLAAAFHEQKNVKSIPIHEAANNAPSQNVLHILERFDCLEPNSE